MSYNVTNFTQNYLEVQLKFDQPILVSANRNQPDEIQIEISKFFLVPVRSVILSDLENVSVYMKEKVPLMVGSQLELERLEIMSSSVKKTSMILLILPMCAQLFLKGIMKRLWAFFHAMQLIDSFSYMTQIGLSANALILATGYRDIINAKIIPDSIFKKILQVFQTTNSTNTEARRLLSSNHAIKIAVITVASITTAILFLTCFGLIVFWRRVPKNIKDKLIAFKYIIFFNGIIRIALEFFYPTLCLSLITLMHHDQQSTTMISAGFKVAVCAGFVPFTLSFVAKNEALFEDKDFHLKYGAFFTNVEKYNKPNAMYYPCVFLAHRLLMAAIVACLGFNIVLQVSLLTHLNLILLCWLIVVQPMDNFLKNVLELTNGFLVLLMSYFSFTASDYVPDPQIKFNIGYVYIAIILLFFVYNLIFQIAVGLIDYCMQRKNKRILNIKQEEERLEAEKKDPNRLTIRERLALRMKEAALRVESVANKTSNQQQSDKSIFEKSNEQPTRNQQQKVKKSQKKLKIVNQKTTEQKKTRQANLQHEEPGLLLEPSLFFAQQAKLAAEELKKKDAQMLRLELNSENLTPAKDVSQVAAVYPKLQPSQIEEQLYYERKQDYRIQERENPKQITPKSSSKTNVSVQKHNQIQNLSQNSKKFPLFSSAESSPHLLAQVQSKKQPLQIEEEFYEGITEDQKMIRIQWTIPPAKLYAEAIRLDIEAAEEEKRRETQLIAQKRGNKSKSSQKKETLSTHKKKKFCEEESKNDNRPSQKQDLKTEQHRKKPGQDDWSELFSERLQDQLSSSSQSFNFEYHNVEYENKKIYDDLLKEFV